MQRFASHISQNEPPRSIFNSYMMSSEHKSLASNTSSHFYHDAYIFGVLWGYAEPEVHTAQPFRYWRPHYVHRYDYGRQWVKVIFM